MRKITFKATLFAAGIFTIGLTACKKENILLGHGPKPTKEINTNKTLVNEEGIISHDGFNSRGTGSIIRGYYQLLGPSPGQQPNGSFPLVNPVVATTTGCGASHGINVYLYNTPSGILYLDGWYGNVAIVDASFNPFTFSIEEIEIHPMTQEVYALVSNGFSRFIYIIDPMTGVATPASVNGGGAIVFNNAISNGYQCGSITFVPASISSYELVFSHESTVYASLGVVSWHFSTSGTSLTSVVANNHTYAGIPGTSGTGINTTYGNGKLYFARHGSSNPVYSLSLTPSVNTYTSEGFSVTNTNDFGYWYSY
jgi:hypothetical protein